MKEQLEIANKEKADAIQTLLNLVQPQKQMISTEPVLRVPLQTASKPWRIRQKELEQEDAHEAKIRRQNSINRLETALDITEPASEESASDAIRSGDAQVQTR